MNFSDIRNHLYNEAEKYWLSSMLIGFLVQVVAILALIINNHYFLVIAGAVTLFIPIVGKWLQEISNDKANSALKCRLAILYSDAFGEDIPAQISRDICAMVSGEKVKGAPFIKPYYDSKIPHGTKRLAGIVSESAFWTYNLAKKMVVLIGIYTGCYFLLGLILAYFIVQMNIESALLLVIFKSFIAYISFVLGSESIILIKKYNELWHKSEQTYKETDRFSRRKKLSTVKIMQIVEEYNLLLINSPPIPSFIYKISKRTLNDAYKNSLEVE